MVVHNGGPQFETIRAIHKLSPFKGDQWIGSLWVISRLEP